MQEDTNIPRCNADVPARIMLQAGAALANPRKNPDAHGAHFVVLPPGHSVGELPRDPRPDHPKALVRLRDAPSFIGYVNDHKFSDSRIFASLEPARFLAVIDEFAADPELSVNEQAAWREFRVDFTVPPSREWLLWNKANRQHMSQLGFAEFLEDNLPDVMTPDGATLLEMANNFEAAQTGSFVATQRLQDGSHNLQWRADNNAAGTVRLPQQITLLIPVFENDQPATLDARLRYRINDGKLAIWYELIRPHKVLEAAFRNTWKRIANETGVPILLGSPE